MDLQGCTEQGAGSREQGAGSSLPPERRLNCRRQARDQPAECSSSSSLSSLLDFRRTRETNLRYTVDRLSAISTSPHSRPVVSFHFLFPFFFLFFLSLLSSFHLSLPLTFSCQVFLLFFLLVFPFLLPLLLFFFYNFSNPYLSQVPWGMAGPGHFCDN